MGRLPRFEDLEVGPRVPSLPPRQACSWDWTVRGRWDVGSRIRACSAPLGCEESKPVLTSAFLQALCSSAPAGGPGKVMGCILQLGSQTGHPSAPVPYEGAFVSRHPGNGVCMWPSCWPFILLYLPNTHLEFPRIFAPGPFPT